MGPIVVNTQMVHHFSMKRTDPQFKLRIPPEVKAAVDEASKSNHRSLNAEIVARLKATIDVEAALNQIAPGCPITEAAQLILDLAAEREEAVENLHQFNLEVHAKELNQRFAYSEARLDKIESLIKYMIEQFQLSKQQ